MKKIVLLTLSLAFVASVGFAQALTVANHSFETDAETAFPGYRTSITDWTMSDTGYGINSGSPFMDNGTVPHGTKVLFIQNVGSATQNVAGFVAATKYEVRIRVNSRAATPIEPTVRISVNGTEILPPTAVAPVGGSNPFTLLAPSYTATASGAFDVRIENTNGSGDNTLLVDQVEIVEVPSAAKDWNLLQ